MAAYYNELDPYAAQWLRNLIAAGHIAPGEVDERDIRDVAPEDLNGFAQCHFFAGIGVWSHALRLAGWDDDRAVWTGSCPCQPFSAAGRRSGFDDERHLWPAWFHLIGERRPPVVFGEQVASKDADAWIDLVQDDMEAVGYAFGAVPFPSAGVGAPHIRDRLYYVARELAHSNDGGRERRRTGEAGDGGDPARVEPERLRDAGGVADPRCERWIGREGIPAGRDYDGAYAGWQQGHDGLVGVCEAGSVARPPGPTNGQWGAADWLLCRDGKWRPVEPDTSPLAHGAPSRVGRLRAYGNAINAQAARHFIEIAEEHAP